MPHWEIRLERFRWQLKRPNARIRRLISKVDAKLNMMKIVDVSYLKGVKTPTFEHPIFPNLFIVSSENFLTGFNIEYVPDPEFIKKQHHLDGKKIHYKDILKHSRHTMALGSAGAGKTTLIRFFAKRGKKLWPKIQLVIYLEFRNFVSGLNVLLDDVILGTNVCPEFTDADHRKELRKWMIDHQKRVLFCIDGYDQLKTPFTDHETVKLAYDASGKGIDFLRNIINGHLFGQSKVITSSREHAVHNLPGDCRPSMFVQLAGFSKRNIDKAVVSLSDEEVLNRLKAKNIVLYTMCSQPLYTGLIVGVYKVNPDNPPDTLTGILMFLISNFIRSDSIRGNTCESFPKLIKMAFEGTRDGKVVFTDVDLRRHSLNRHDIADFFNVIPNEKNSKLIVRNLIEEGVCVNFVHQNIQEFFSSLSLLSLDPENFKEFVKSHFKDGHWIMVKRMICGIVCQPEFSTQWKELNECKKRTRYKVRKFKM